MTETVSDTVRLTKAPLATRVGELISEALKLAPKAGLTLGITVREKNYPTNAEPDDRHE